jgi:hypothetical protein
VASPSYFSAGKATDLASVIGTVTEERVAYDAETRAVVILPTLFSYMVSIAY